MAIHSSVNCYTPLMVTDSLAVLNKSSITKKTEIEMEIVEVLQQTSDSRKKAGNQNIRVMKFLALTLYLLARLTQILILAFVIYW